MTCPHCMIKAKIVNSCTDEDGDATYRCYKCLKCGYRFVTVEVQAVDDPETESELKRLTNLRQNKRLRALRKEKK